MIVRPILIAAAALMLASATGQGALMPVDAPVQVAVRFDPGTTAVERSDALSSVGLGGSRAVPGVPGVRVVTVPPGTSPARAADRLERDPVVRWADPVVTMRTQATPNDPRFGQVWGLAGPGDDVNVLSAWNVTTGSHDVAVGVVDTGAAPDHPDLTANLRTSQGRNFVTGALPSAWADQEGHGTHVAGTIGAVGNNGLGVAGVNWQVGIIPVRVLDMTGSGSDVDVAAGAAYAADHARVVNMSLGGGYSQPLADVVTAHPNTLFVVAAGNDGANVDFAPLYPCALPNANIICVASTTQNGGKSSFSNFGATTVDLGAPGSGIESTTQSFVTVFADPTLATFVSWTQAGLPASPTPWQRRATPPPSYSVANLEGTLTVGPWDLITPVGGITPLLGTACRLAVDVDLNLNPSTQSFSVQATAPSVAGGAWQGVQAPVAGTTNGFEALTVDLTAFDGQSDVQVRFRVAGPAGVYGGAGQYTTLRYPQVSCITPEPVGGTYGQLSGTSMATPAVAGAAALLLSNQPSLTVAQLRQALLSTVTPMSSLQGVTPTVTGGRLNVAAALAAIQPAPVPIPAPAPEVQTVPTPTTPSTLTTLTTPMALTLRGAQPVKLKMFNGKVKPSVQCRGSAAANCVMTMQLRYWMAATATKKGYWKVIGSLRASAPSGWTGTRTVPLTFYGKNLVKSKVSVVAQLRMAPRDGATGLTTTGRVRIVAS